MAKDVNLLSYWMPLLRGIREFQEIAQTEEPELKYILEAIDRTLDNFFIETADEQGIKRFESMMKIIPNDKDNLEIRRFRVFTEWNNYVPYTDVELFRKLVAICGSDELFNIEEHYAEYWLKVTTNLNESGAFDLVADALKEMLPCNLVLELENILGEKTNGTLYIGGVCSTLFRHCITNDLDAVSSTEALLGVGTVINKVGTHVITQDLNKTISNSGDPQVATSVNIATTVTLN